MGPSLQPARADMFASGKSIRWPWLAMLKSRAAVVASSNPAAPLCIDTAADLSLGLAMFADQCGEAVVICDARQRIVFANLAFERLTGVATHVLIGEKSAQLHDLSGDRLSIASAAIPSGSAAVAHYVYVLAPTDQSQRAEDSLRQFIDIV
jgi:PAS domain-containing protein